MDGFGTRRLRSGIGDDFRYLSGSGEKHDGRWERRGNGMLSMVRESSSTYGHAMVSDDTATVRKMSYPSHHDSNVRLGPILEQWFI